MDVDEYETLPTNNFAIHMSAGAIAGVMEHCVMYPLDSVKTRMQSLSPNVNYRGVMEALHTMIQQEGIMRPVRGMGAVVAGAGPAHALYFSCYEFLKEKLQSRTTQPLYFVAGVSGVMATLLHDGVMTPSEVVKQRLQMLDSPYKSILECVRRTYQSEGISAFYRSYTTQLTMNVPFQSIHFIMYEFCQNVTNKDRLYNPPAHMVSGAIAGAVAAAVTTPLDVCKTLLNTQQHRVVGMVAAFKTVYRLGGAGGYFRGIQARVLYQMPSTAICWSMYEFFKYLLSPTNENVKCTEKFIGSKSSPTVLVSDNEISTKIRPGFLLVVPQVNLEPENKFQSHDAKSREFTDEEKDIFNYTESTFWGNSVPSSVHEAAAGSRNVKKESEEKQEVEKYGKNVTDKVSRPDRSEWSSLKTTSVSSPSIIGALNFNTVHRDDDIRNSNFYDITRS